jgi:hypothetical protein
MSETTIGKFKADLRGELIQRNDERYEEARKLYNGMIDKRPLLIARCVDVADVITAVNFGRDLDLLIAIRGGGHNGPGLGSCDDGLVIDLSMMKSVPIFNWMGAMPFPAMQALFDPFFPKGLQWYWKGDFVKSLPDEAIDTHIAQAAKAPSELSLMHLYPIDGAVHRVTKDAMAWDAREATWSMVIAGIDSNPKQADALKTWGREYWKVEHTPRYRVMLVQPLQVEFNIQQACDNFAEWMEPLVGCCTL